MVCIIGKFFVYTAIVFVPHFGFVIAAGIAAHALVFPTKVFVVGNGFHFE